MKKLLCIAIFSVAIVVNANNKNETVKSVFKDVKIEKKLELDARILAENNETLSQNKLDFFGCGSSGNDLYDLLMSTGMFTHREARAERRAWVRDCRGLPEGGWLPTGAKILKTAMDIYKLFG